MENNFTDKPIVDHAWNTMRATLDKEMPVEKKRRAMWWLPAIACLLAIGGWYLFGVNQDADPFQKQSAPTKIVTKEIAKETEGNGSLKSNYLATDSDNNANVEKTKEYSNHLARTERPNNKVKTKTITTTTIKSVALKSTNTKHKNGNLNKNLTQNVIPTTLNKKLQFSKDLSKTNSNPLTAINKKEDPQIILTDQELKNEKNEVRINREELAHSENEAVLAIENLPIQPFENEGSFSFSDIDNLMIRKWNWMLEASFLSNFKNNARTILLEGQVARQLSKKWSIKSGLGIKSQNYVVFQSDPELESNLFYDFQNEDLITNVPSTASGDLSIPSSKIRKSYEYLYIPLNVGFRFKNRWLAEGGVNFNFLNFNRVSLTKSGERQSANISSNPFVKHFSLSYDLGISYLLNSKLAVGIQSQYNTSRFNTDSAKEPGRTQIGLFANYKF